MLTCRFQKWKEILKAPKWKLKGLEIEGPEGGFKMPKMKMPSFG